MTKVNTSNLKTIEFPEAKLISINEIVLEVFEAGKENFGNPIILCHGFPELAFSWRYQIPILVEAGYHVIAPNQRGYGNSSRPSEIEAYDILNLTNDMVALLDHFNYKSAIFIGHDWGANVIWNLALLHPQRVDKVINLALPYQERGQKPWIELMEEVFGEEFYFVHFNRQPGIADKILERNTARFLNNLFRKNIPVMPPDSGMLMINLANEDNPKGDSLMSKEELDVYIKAFKQSGFTGSINWYRNLDRNWHLMSSITPKINHETLMIYGNQDSIPKSPNLEAFAPNLEVISLDAGHCIQQEKPEETNNAIIEWLKRKTI